MTTNGVLFDVDGTLIDSHETHVDSWLEYAAREGIVLDRDRVNQTFGMVNREVVRSFWPGSLTEKQIDEISDGKEAMVREKYRRSFPAMDGATELIETLHQHGFQLAVGSSGPKENVDMVCQMLGVIPYLDGIVTGSEVRHGKPHPEVFLTAAKRIGVPPNHCVVVEDAVVGIHAAHAAGMKCIAILSTGHTEDELREADRLIRSLREISPEMIHELLSI